MAQIFQVLMNPWVVGIGVTVIAGLILNHVFKIGRKENIKTKTEEYTKRVGIQNNGKNNQFINNIFENFDVGIEDKGEGTVAKGNKFK